MSNPNDILIVDDHSLILDGISSILKKIPYVSSVTALSTGADVCRAIKEKNYDAYILDLELPDIQGFELIEIIQGKYPSARIIINTMHEEVWTVNRLLRLGVDGIVLKSSASELLGKALESVLTGKTYFCPRFNHLRGQQGSYIKRIKDKNSLPTGRELVILECIVKGMTTNEIADELCITVNTVESHRKNLMIKLDARNVAHLVSIAFEQRLVGKN